ncbi:hypothetical protein BJY01DRAFT_249723 [Aspergillus pseudoustus]|uniref:FAD-binding domain-containing protein n=1 Tax=Aspergillus pseudoustus TaxID=1810923 RepID=A0ABR4JLU7_9EURO
MFSLNDPSTWPTTSQVDSELAELIANGAVPRFTRSGTDIDVAVKEAAHIVQSAEAEPRTPAKSGSPLLVLIQGGALAFGHAEFETQNAKTMTVSLTHHRRIDREKLRKLLCDGIDVQWNKTFDSFRETEQEILVSFKDGRSVLGSLVVGADGAQSMIRKQLCPDTHELRQLPIRFLGTTIKLSPEDAKVFTSLDKLMFQATHPLNISWPVRGPDNETPNTNPARIAKLKALAEAFEPRFRKPVMSIPDDAKVVEIKVRKWPVLDWPTLGGKITLTCDATHAMTMYRGEAANHGITDASVLKENLVKMWASEGLITQAQALETFEAEMRPRTL